MAGSPKLEIACFNANSAKAAQQCGADRIELCDGFEVGGTTPSLQMWESVRPSAIPVYVMIRPRGGDFVYTQAEFMQMQAEIKAFKNQGIAGFVFGILHTDHTINVAQNKLLVELAQPLPCTFHRAFDQVSDPFEALEQLIECGFQTILTSGQQPNVMAGLDRLAALVKKSGQRIAIMPGGGLRSSNIGQLQQVTKAGWYHSSAITMPGQTADPQEIKALKAHLK